VFISITALASWCEGTKSWLTGLPVDEIVPMAFSMGPTAPAITTMLQRGGEFAFAGCRQSIGVELLQPSPAQRFGVVTPPAVIAVQPNVAPWLLGGVTTPSIRPHKLQRAYFFPRMHTWSAETLKKARELIQP
jgi:hypothetical protein